MRYFMTQRPAGPGTMPKDGLVDILPGEQQKWLPRHVWNVLVYDRELTRKEVRAYELTPDIPPVQYKGYEIRFLPYTWEWAIINPESCGVEALAYTPSLQKAQALIDDHT